MYTLTLRRHVIPSCFNINSPATPGFESGFTGLQRTSLFWVQWSLVDAYFIPFFSPMRYASASGLEMKVPFNNNLNSQTNDVMVNPINPENPDSKTTRCSTHQIKQHPTLTLHYRWIFLPYHNLDPQTIPAICHPDDHYR